MSHSLGIHAKHFTEDEARRQADINFKEFAHSVEDTHQNLIIGVSRSKATDLMLSPIYSARRV